MVKCIEKSASNTKCILPNKIIWIDWKFIFKEVFIKPSQLSTSIYHEFLFDENSWEKRELRNIVLLRGLLLFR